MKGTNKKINLWLMIVVGLLLGNFLGDAIGNGVRGLSFLKTVYFIGLSSPLVFNLKILKFTFGLNFNLNIMALVGVVLAIIIYKKY